VTIAPLDRAIPDETFGGKAASLARALAAGLPVPDGFAVGWGAVAGAADSDAVAAGAILTAWRESGLRRAAVRSSAIGEDSRDASFAGQHVTILNVTTEDALLDAVRKIHASASEAGATEYRRRMGIDGEPRMAVVVQEMVDSESAGVLFTRDPMSGARERVIESSWGLGEAVVSGLVTPDRFRVSDRGAVLERQPGRKDFVIRYAPDGGTVERPVPAEDMARLSLTDEQLLALHRLAEQCETFFGEGQDIEWAIADGEVRLLQARPITVRGGGVSPKNEEVTDPLTARRFTGLALAALLAPLNSTIIAVALPSIATAFDSPAAVVTRWLVTAYLVVSIVAQSPAGKLADLWGYSRVLTIGRGLFGAGALLAALSPALPILGAGRVLMAVGGALSVPTVFAQLRNSVPHERRGRVFGIFGAIMGAAAATGPVLGGFLTARYGWHSVFVVNVPVVLLSFLLEPPRRAETTRAAARRARFDVPGSVLLAVAVLLLVAGVETSMPAYLFGAAAAVAGFIVRELRAGDPVLDVRLFTRVSFAAGSAIVALQNLAMYSMLFLLPFFLARAGGAPSTTGRMLLLFTAAMVVASPIGGRASDAIGARVVTVAGALVATTGAALFVAQADLMTALLLMGGGIGIATSPSQAAALGAVAAEQAGVASGALSTMRYVGGVIGSGLVAMLVARGDVHDPRLMVFPAVLLLSAAVALALPGKRRLPD